MENVSLPELVISVYSVIAVAVAFAFAVRWRGFREDALFLARLLIINTAESLSSLSRMVSQRHYTLPLFKKSPEKLNLS